MNAKQNTVIEYRKRFYYMLKGGAPVGEVKRLLYDDLDVHKRLGLTETNLDSIWENLMARSYDNNPSIPKTPELLVPESTKTFGTENNNFTIVDKVRQGRKADPVAQIDPLTNRVIAYFDSVRQAADLLGLNQQMIYFSIRNEEPYKDFLFKKADAVMCDATEARRRLQRLRKSYISVFQRFPNVQGIPELESTMAKKEQLLSTRRVSIPSQ